MDPYNLYPPISLDSLDFFLGWTKVCYQCEGRINLYAVVFSHLGSFCYISRIYCDEHSPDFNIVKVSEIITREFYEFTKSSFLIFQ